MDEWRRGIPTPHLATSIPHYHGLDFGRTMPLRHPPTTIHGRPNITSSPQTFLPFSHPLGHPLPIPMASRELSISTSSSSFSPTQIQASTTESSARAQNVEKKRWQTANYRWMFTKRKGNKCNLLSIELKNYKPHAYNIKISDYFCYIVYKHVNKLVHRHISLHYYILVCIFSFNRVRFFECTLNAPQIIQDKI